MAQSSSGTETVTFPLLAPPSGLQETVMQSRFVGGLLEGRVFVLIAASSTKARGVHRLKSIEVCCQVISFPGAF